MERLIRVAATSQEQIRLMDEIHNGEGTCTCGHVFTPLSAKFILGNFLTQHPTDKNLRGCVVLGAYCVGCFTRINNLLKALNHKHGGLLHG